MNGAALVSAAGSKGPPSLTSNTTRTPHRELGIDEQDREGRSPADGLLDPSGFDIDDDDGDFGWPEEEQEEARRYSDMPSDLRPSLDRHDLARSQDPLLPAKHGGYGDENRSPMTPASHHSRLHERDPEILAARATRTKYLYASFFLVLSLVTFVIQTETAWYIADHLKWKKSYCMLYFTHGSWVFLWPAQLLILRIQKWRMPWSTFWRRHLTILAQTAHMVESQAIHPPNSVTKRSPLHYMVRTTALVTCCLTLAGGSWYVAVNLTSTSDLTAIYNCSAFFAYVFSVPLLHEKLRWSKVSAVLVAIMGVIVVAYGGSIPPKHGSKSGGGTGGAHPPEGDEPSNPALGNIVISVGSVLYGFYEVLYKKVACPPEGCSPGRAMIFANTFGSCIGLFTLTVLWIPLPILHFTGIETFEWPRGQAAWMLLISVLSNATFSGSFLVLISLTSPVLSSVAALLTIFLVALVDAKLLPMRFRRPLTPAAIIGGLLIIVAFVVLTWATYREMDEERRRKMEMGESDDEDEGVLGG